VNQPLAKFYFYVILVNYLMRIVLSVGGSIIIPNNMNLKFLKKFKKLLKKFVKKGWKIGIVCGGGATARKYVRSGVKMDNKKKDILGIMATRINAKLMTYHLGELARKEVFENTTEMAKRFGKKIVVSGGTTPGHTTDLVASESATKVKADLLINLTNVKGVYNKDPKKYKNAEMIKKITWDEFFKKFKLEYMPSMNFVFAPPACKLCRKEKIKVAVVKGTNLKNLNNLLLGKNWVGTLIYS